MRISAGNIKKGEFILYNGNPCQVQKAEFYAPGKGAALMRTKLKNVVTGKNTDFTFKSSEYVESIEVGSIEMQYLYKDNENAYCMDLQYDQHIIPLSVIGHIVN